ncbi:MAG TPA: PIN domain-containing protein [Steroidobacteraceae bacterium]|nr:PIN domain-containing protein [Steroidobacteraceae bacterium]
MVPYDRFTVVLDACTLFPMLARDVLLTLAAHEFFSPKWSARIRDEWTRNLLAQMQERSADGDAQKRVDRIVAAMTAAFPDADVDVELVELPALEPVDAKDRHVVATAIAAHADAIVTFNVKDFAADHLKERLQIEVIHPDDFIMDLIDLNEKRAVAAFRELRARKKNPPWTVDDIAKRLQASGFVQTSMWLNTRDVAALM